MTSDTGTAWLFPNHTPPSIVSGYQSISANDTIIAIDNGLSYLHRLQIQPHLIVGDMDSLQDKRLLDEYPDAIIERYPSAKNETDTELAVCWCIEHQIKNIVICNDMRGRLDHCLGLIQNLLKAFEAGISCRIETPDSIIRFLDEDTIMDLPLGSALSLVPYSDEIHLDHSEGLEYSLHNLHIHRSESRAISNRIVADKIRITKSLGTVLCIVTIL
ncbi:MAG: thiamine diphosphokinase [Candidatus Cloacimonetes bacterium HGW-Cloacimonetes-1]|jgi:thiamine pyrophosphokinase|nr:MAG: thiamine diphosphokinase [Candidatus Cloacimonetes bacterium HGW-Cloacimonetes-1]